MSYLSNFPQSGSAKVSHRPTLQRRIQVLAGVAVFSLAAVSGWSQASINEGLETASIYVDAVHGNDSNS